MWYVKVTGTFTYGNGSAKCTSSDVSTKVYSSNWKLSNVSSARSGATAYAHAIGKCYNQNTVIQTIDKTVSLTCSSTGNLS